MWSKFTCVNNGCPWYIIRNERLSETNLSSYKRKKCPVCGKMMKKDAQ